MPNNKILSRPHVAKSQGRHAFDRSFIRNYSQSAGMIVPVMFEPCLAGTKGKINRQVFTRSAQVIAPAFPAIKMEYDFFKIPIRYLWSKWNDWKLNINDLNSSTLVSVIGDGTANLSLEASVPRFNFTTAFGGYFHQLLMNYRNTETPAQWAVRLNDAFRLLEPIYGYKCNGVAVSSNYIANVKSLFGLAAYQKVYYDHFRNTSYENNNPFAYNLDWLMNESTPNLLSVSDAQHYYMLENMLTLRYVNYRNDYYHNIYPALNYTASSPNGLDWKTPSNIQGLLGASPSSSLYNSGRVQVGGYITLTTPPGNDSTITSVQNIRAAFALDKLLRASAYAPKHVKEQLLARYGVNVGDKVSYESERIGSFDHDIIIGEVTATTPAALGAVGGKGVGADNYGKDIDFYCEEDSIIIGVSYVIPRAIYDNVQDEWHNNLIREDFYQPEFENLGLRPMYNPAYPQFIAGYAPPYQRLKLGRDLNLGEFNESVYPVDLNSAETDVESVNRDGSLSAYTIHTAEYAQTNNGVNYKYFKVKPSDLDPIFAASYPSTGSPYLDHFFSHLQIKFNTVQGTSYHGQPSL